MYRFSASVVMEVTYGYDMKGGETFVTSMQHSADIFISVATPELFAMCAALPFGGCYCPLSYFLISFDLRLIQ